LFDLEGKPAEGDHYSIGRIVLDDFEGVMGEEGSWLEPAPVDLTAHSGWVDPCDLKVGKFYRITEETPLMSTNRPSDPMKELAKTVYLPAGTSFRVLSIDEPISGNPWYMVDAALVQGSTRGYINCVALIGQDL